MDLTREDWERVKKEVEQEKKTMEISLAINSAALDMIDARLGALPEEKGDSEVDST